MTNPTHMLELGSDDVAKPTTNTWTITSDERIKRDIEDADPKECLDLVSSLRVRKFGYNDIYKNACKVRYDKKYGLIAQELSEVYAQAVQIIGGVSKFEKRDEKGEVISTLEIPNLQTINADELNYCVYGAIKKLKEENEELKRENIDLMSRVSRLENRFDELRIELRRK